MSDTTRQIETATLQWEGRTIAITYEAPWLGDDSVAHLTVTCIDPPHDPLPITETGYRSAFFHVALDDDFPGGADFVGYTEAWLDKAAQTKSWRAHVEANRQLRFF